MTCSSACSSRLPKPSSTNRVSIWMPPDSCCTTSARPRARDREAMKDSPPDSVDVSRRCPVHWSTTSSPSPDLVPSRLWHRCAAAGSGRRSWRQAARMRQRQPVPAVRRAHSCSGSCGSCCRRAAGGIRQGGQHSARSCGPRPASASSWYSAAGGQGPAAPARQAGGQAPRASPSSRPGAASARSRSELRASVRCQASPFLAGQNEFLAGEQLVQPGLFVVPGTDRRIQPRRLRRRQQRCLRVRGRIEARFRQRAGPAAPCASVGPGRRLVQLGRADDGLFQDVRSLPRCRRSGG